MEGEEERKIEIVQGKVQRKRNKQNGKRGRNKQRERINMFTRQGCEAR
jgi:hypothetical protein